MGDPNVASRDAAQTMNFELRRLGLSQYTLSTHNMRPTPLPARLHWRQMQLETRRCPCIHDLSHALMVRVLHYTEPDQILCPYGKVFGYLCVSTGPSVALLPVTACQSCICSPSSAFSSVVSPLRAAKLSTTARERTASLWQGFSMHGHVSITQECAENS